MCIDAYETQPVLVRTPDLLEVVRLLRAVNQRHTPSGAGDAISASLDALEQRLVRPRRIVKPTPSGAAAAEKTCGKCGGAINDDDDCQRCYPR